jgi:Carboxypeptidase regulatory-like domain
MLTVQKYWMRFGKEFGVCALMLSLASGVSYAASTAVVSGVVRDTQGVPQMGAVVQVLAAGSVSVATAFTDMRGRYRIANLVPGKYQVQATAILFSPATRRNLLLANGMRATVNLTLSMLSDPTAWLPAERRKPDEPGDDWTWTLRSAANRPILRMLDDGEIVMVASSAKDAPQIAPTVAHAAVVSGDGGFGGGGIQSVIALDRVTREGSDVVLRADVAAQRPGLGDVPGMEVDAGYARTMGLGNESRMVVSYASHPEIASAEGTGGLQVIRMASAEKMHVSDSVDVEAGATVYAIHTTGDTLTTQPFLRVTVHPGEVWAVRYRLASSRNVQSFEGLDSIATDIPVTAVNRGRSCVESGSHQEIAVTRKLGRGQAEAALYRDTVDHSAIAGTGAISAADMAAGGGKGGVMVDTATGSFRFLGAGYGSTGMSLMVSEPLNSGLWAALEYASGAALAMRNSAGERLPEVSADMRPEIAGAATVALKGRVQRTGTKVSASYRWQPRHLVTAVNPYESFSNQAYLSFYVRQAVRWGDRLPPGLEATIDVTNLLEEGYQPFLSSDGRTLFLAQSPRAIQAGLSFTF